MSLRTKFNLVLLLALVVGLALAGLISYRITQDNARQEVLRRAELMMESALSVRAYTVDQIAPLLSPHMEDVFLPQTVPSYAAQTSFRRLRAQDEFAEYNYKEAALNPTNLNDLATDWEAEIIYRFRGDPTLSSYDTTRPLPGGAEGEQQLVLARPLQVGDEACLACHSVPEAAPASMLAQYGATNGFGWELNEIIGAQIVSVPMSVPIERANQTFSVFMAGLVIVFVVVVLLLNLMLQFVVVRPVVRMSQMADAVSMGEEDVPELELRGGDEIGSLSRSFNRMRRSLENAMRMLDT